MSAPQLYYQPGGIAEKVLAHCTAIKQPFNPTVWAPNAHMQSAMGLLRTATAKGSYTRQLVMTSDHGTLGLDWWCGADKPTYAAPDAPIVMFIHGINGGSHEGYVKWACMAAASRGWRAVVLNMRGCNGLQLTSARGYNAINTSDLHVAVQSIHSRFPAAPLTAAGYSLGSVLLAKYLAEADNGLYIQQQDEQQQGAEASAAAAGVPQYTGSGLVAAALVSPPVCLHTTNSRMGKPNSFKFMYNLAVAYKLREYVKEHMPTIQGSGMNIDTEAMLNSWTVSSFDDAVTLRALGYPAPHFYYRHACSTNYIPHIRTPTLILLSKDDPFLGVLPQQQVMRNPFTVLAATRRGGHLAFLQGWWPLGASYCDNVIDEWLGAAVNEWRHGCDAPAPGAAAAASLAVSLASSVTSNYQQQQSEVQEAPVPAQQQAGRSGSSSSSRWSLNGVPGRCGAAAAAARPPSWVERAIAGGWQPQQFDPTCLSSIMCTCHPELNPLARAQAADAVLNAATAPAQAAAAAAGRAAGSAGKLASSARHSWSFGFSSSKPSPAVQSKPGLRGGGAWAFPFESSDSTDGIGAGAGVGVLAGDGDGAAEVISVGGTSIGRQPAGGVSASHSLTQGRHVHTRRSKL